MTAAVTASGTTLTELRGIGNVTAVKNLARAGVVGRFRSESAIASYCGAALTDISPTRPPCCAAHYCLAPAAPRQPLGARGTFV
ncbi:transposase [Micromonospora sp. NBC_01638]|uniref:transposase n=1 Tax=Micromonospora sp. NBC_01638 TaxID=2975982 RepID=UPI00386ECEEC